MSNQKSDVPKFKYHKTSDIHPGDVILEEDLWLWSFRNRYNVRLRCNSCFASVTNAKNAPLGEQTSLKRCGGCKVACYCSKTCQESDWKTRHKHECAIHKHFATKHEYYFNWAPDAGASYNTFGSTWCAQVVLALASKALKAAEQKAEENPDAELGLVEAYRKMPLSIARDKVQFNEDEYLNQHTDFDRAQRILPAFISLCSGDRVHPMYQSYGVGICLEMSRFGAHACNPNAIALLGDGRTMRVIATSPIASLDDVRLNRLPGDKVVEAARMQRQGSIFTTLGYNCKCARCEAWDENDPLNMYLLRCPKNASCSGEVKNLYYDYRLNSKPHFQLPMPTDARSVAARMRESWVGFTERTLTPCSVCGARYKPKVIANDLVHLMRSGINRHCGKLPYEIQSAVLSRSALLAKRHLHPTCQRYKMVMQDALSGGPTSVIQSVAEGNDFIREYFQLRLRQFSDAVAGTGTDLDRALDLNEVAYYAKEFMPLYTKFYDQHAHGCHGNPQACRALSALSGRICDKANTIMKRALTPKQWNNFSLGDLPHLFENLNCCGHSH